MDGEEANGACKKCATVLCRTGIICSCDGGLRCRRVNCYPLSCTQVILTVPVVNDVVYSSRNLQFLILAWFELLMILAGLRASQHPIEICSTLNSNSFIGYINQKLLSLTSLGPTFLVTSGAAMR